MKRFFFVAVAALALLVPTLTFAQGVKTEYIPGAHPRVVVVQSASETAVKTAAAPLTPAQVIALHEPMANGYRAAVRVNYSAVAHCERLVNLARAELRTNF